MLCNGRGGNATRCAVYPHACFCVPGVELSDLKSEELTEALHEAVLLHMYSVILICMRSGMYYGRVSLVSNLD